MTDRSPSRRQGTVTSSPLGAKLIAILVGVGVALGAAGFGAGFLTGAKGHSELEARLERERNESKQLLASQRDELESDRVAAVAKVSKQRDAVKTRLTDLERRASKLEARRELGRVLLTLDDRNFGIAQKHLDASVAHLERAGEFEGSAALVKQLQEGKVVVAGNLAKQRALFRESVDHLDELLDAEPSGR